MVRHIVIEALDVNAHDDHGRTVLFSTVALNKMDLVRCLVRHGANMHHKDVRGRAAVHYGTQEMFRVLVDCGLDTNATRSWCRSCGCLVNIWRVHRHNLRHGINRSNHCHAKVLLQQFRKAGKVIRR